MLVRVKTKEELLKLGLTENNGELWDTSLNDCLTGKMLDTLGKVYKVEKLKKFDDGRNGLYIKYDDWTDVSFTYYPKWVEVMNTKAAKILFKR